MTMRISVRAIAALTLLGMALAPAVPHAQGLTAADLFNSQTLQEIRLSINTRDLDTLRKNYQLNTYYTADLTWRTMKVRNVGVRSRGTGSRRPDKMGLLIDFSRYTTGQTFLGMSTLVLDNNYQDPTLMHEFLAMSLYRRMGQIAPREAFCRVYINNTYQGIYTVVETITPSFAQQAIGEVNGFLYEYHFLQPPALHAVGVSLDVYNGEDLGDNLTAYAALFEPQNHKLDAPSALYGPIRDLWREVNGPDDEVWRDRVGPRIDLNQFVTHTAIQGYLAENDGILGFAGMNNFYLYRSAVTNQHRLIPWDEDFAFTPGFEVASIFRSGPVVPVIFTRAMERRDLYDLFLNTAEACAISADQDGWLVNEIERVINLILPSVVEDTNRDSTPGREFSTGIEQLRTFAATRSSFVLPEVARLRLPGLD